MFALLMSLGILVAAAGGAALAFGIPNNGFDLGNTLIIAGTTAICGGLVMIGLAACVRELRRMSDALPSRLGARPLRGGEGSPEAPAAAAARAAASPRMPYPAMPAADDAARPFDPRLVPPGPAEEPALERSRANVFPIGRPPGEHPAVDEPEAVPLAPARGPGAPLGRTLPPAIEPPYEPKFGPADILARLSGQGRAAARAEPARPFPPEERPPDRPVEPTPAPPSAKEHPHGPAFDTVWPSVGKLPGRAAGPDTIPRVSRPEGPPEPRVEPRERFEPHPVRSELPPARGEPPMSSEPRDLSPPPRADARPVAILKSGVIDGMAYTLYTDGSIEAQLPQGTMHFGSIEELRAHLENQG